MTFVEDWIYETLDEPVLQINGDRGLTTTLKGEPSSCVNKTSGTVLNVDGELGHWFVAKEGPYSCVHEAYNSVLEIATSHPRDDCTQPAWMKHLWH